MQKSGTEAESLRQALENTRNHVGISGIYNISATDHNGLGTDSMVIVEVKDGTFKLAD
jgi:branched-chain amino acid transport system substrate-binding protein